MVIVAITMVVILCQRKVKKPQGELSVHIPNLIYDRQYLIKSYNKIFGYLKVINQAQHRAREFRV